MSTFNRVTAVGNLTREPELKYIPSGQPVLNFGVATNRRYQSSDGEEKEQVCFFECEIWGKKAEVIQEYFTKGDPIFIEGDMKTNSWETDEGETRSRLIFSVRNFQFLPGVNYGDSRSGPGGSNERPSNTGRSLSEEDKADFEDAMDDVPF